MTRSQEHASAFSNSTFSLAWFAIRLTTINPTFVGGRQRKQQLTNLCDVLLLHKPSDSALRVRDVASYIRKATSGPGDRNMFKASRCIVTYFIRLLATQYLDTLNASQVDELVAEIGPHAVVDPEAHVIDMLVKSVQLE